MPSRTVTFSLIAALALAASACASDSDATVATTSPESITTEEGVGEGEAAPLGEQVSSIEVIGDALDPMPPQVAVTEPENDPAIGQKAPELVGTSFDGSTVSVSADGTPRMIMFVAHWCPHCQREVPAVKAMIDDGLLPENLEVIIVSTAVREGEDQYPPQEWLRSEDWSRPILRDSAGFDALLAFGAGGFPFAVYVNGDHEVVTRTAGEIPRETIQQLWLATAAG
jgi:thiol-disulfide isomerase/thioredoxin